MATTKPEDAKPVDEIIESEENRSPKSEAEADPEPFLTPERLKQWAMTPAVQAGALLVALFCAVYWPIVSGLPKLWFDADGYYQHAALVPLAVAALVFKVWPRLKDKGEPVGSWIPIVFLVPSLLLGVILITLGQETFASLTIVSSIGFLVWMLVGFRWALGLAPANLFVAFALPLWGQIIDRYTLSLQMFSTDGTYLMLKALQMNPLRDSPTVIYLDNFPLNIAAACSGMKQTLAMVACVAFISLYADMKLWAKAILVVAAIPLAIVMNSFRITLIGVVGNTSGQEAGMWMHDYGSYGVLALSFFILYKMAQLLGWDV
ncbi:MAG: exosortase/archaeosortase family protein [Fimbriimonadaceae bacterium]|jgi:exosortase|nr:exosortase/archaeosortase family protein [Fimbriimonadaceae bacterium]